MEYQAMQRIVCEDPWQKMWDHYLFFETEPTVRNFLENRYLRLGAGMKEGAGLAYRNAHKMIYLSKQAREFFHTGRNSSMLVRPLLYYYGMVNLAKMAILSLDPGYPGHASLLAHGMTTRKIKRTQYLFMEDEVKIQKDGLLPHLIVLVTGKRLRESYRMKELLASIPELSQTYAEIYGKEEMVRISVSEHLIPMHRANPSPDPRAPSTVLSLPVRILDQKGWRMEEFCDWLNRYNGEAAYFLPGQLDERQGRFSLFWHHPKGLHVKDCPNGFSNRLFCKDIHGQDFLWLNHQEKLDIPEFVVHYLVMYLLGMLCRYEGDLWGEIHFSFYSKDLCIIQDFLHIAARKYPNLILNLLLNTVHYFNGWAFER